MGTNKKRIQLAIMLLALVIAAITVAGNVSKPNKYPQIGDRAPDFTLTGLDGKPYRLSDYKGPVVLNFWATYCEPCRLEMPAIQRQADKWGGVTVFGVNIAEKRVAVQSFIDQIGVKFPIVLDDQEEIRRRYGVKDYPTTFFIGADGKVKDVKVGSMEESFIDAEIAALVSPAKGGGA